MSNSTLETAWRRQQQWSEQANRFKNTLSNWRSIVLGLSILAALSGTVSGVIGSDSPFYLPTAILAAVAAAIAPIAAKLRLGSEDTSRWIRARSASEAFKAEIYQFRTQVGDYSGEEAISKLSNAIKRISESVEGIPSLRTPQAPIEDEKLKDLSIDEYLEVRVKTQINDYYRPKANDHAQKANRFRHLHLYLMLFGAVLGAISAFIKVEIGPWIAVVTTITSSILAHAAAGRHDELAIGYHATANRLEEISNLWSDKVLDGSPTPEQKTALVAACEEAISSENQSWHAKFSKVKS